MVFLIRRGTILFYQIFLQFSLSINGRALLCEVNNNHVFCNQLKKSYQLVSGLAVGGNGQKPLGLMNPLNRCLDI